MTVYVGQDIPTLRAENWPWDTVAHLYADDKKELLAFAVKIGLLKSRMQDGGVRGVLHFDLTPRKRREAVRKGAIHLTIKAEAKWIRKHTKKKA